MTTTKEREYFFKYLMQTWGIPKPVAQTMSFEYNRDYDSVVVRCDLPGKPTLVGIEDKFRRMGLKTLSGGDKKLIQDSTNPQRSILFLTGPKQGNTTRGC